jgi:hypothetical protein
VTTNEVAGGTNWTLRSEGGRYVLRYYRHDQGKTRRVRRRLPRSFTKLMAIAYAQAGLATPTVVGDDLEGPNRGARYAYVVDVESARRAARRAK